MQSVEVVYKIQRNSKLPSSLLRREDSRRLNDIKRKSNLILALHAFHFEDRFKKCSVM